MIEQFWPKGTKEAGFHVQQICIRWMNYRNIVLSLNSRPSRIVSLHSLFLFLWCQLYQPSYLSLMLYQIPLFTAFSLTAKWGFQRSKQPLKGLFWPLEISDQSGFIDVNRRTLRTSTKSITFYPPGPTPSGKIYHIQVQYNDQTRITTKVA